MYFLIEYNEGWRMTRHNSAEDFWGLFVLPSSLWIIFPTLVAATIISRLWREL
jgi:hypothetical protein